MGVNNVLAKLPTRVWNLTAGICSHLAKRALTQMLADKTWLALQFMPNVLDAVEVRALYRPVEFFHTKLEKQTFLYVSGFVHSGKFYE